MEKLLVNLQEYSDWGITDCRRILSKEFLICL